MQQSSNAAAMGGFVILCFILGAITFVIIWLYALTDILKSKFSGNNKIIWFLLIIFLPPLGVILYFLIGRDQKLPSAEENKIIKNAMKDKPKKPEQTTESESKTGKYPLNKH